MQLLYTQEGFSGQLGFGKRPLLMIRDLVAAFTDPNSRLAIEIDKQIETTKALIELCMSKHIPVTFTRTIYDPANLSSQLWGQKFPSICALEDKKWTRIHPELTDYSYSVISDTPYITNFHKSPIERFIEENEIDTVILVGATTSGSIRATAVDGIQRGLRVIIPKEAVGDRNQTIQASALTDLNARYADVMNVPRVLQTLEVIASSQ
ncbi:isochorismatase family protein [Alicyclobacillus acidoterrestris]|uniref:Isochorismatase family protein n=1 Tax=Alicyclobacillus acidoterrestris (strain ATCC 49025 / DSM 3922 / CIP 106132 / NCIMB 13137 / GD3B) TaxID=1356854 RepID=A0A9E7CVN4_ALIAG|nr:isochorismatase family protein [Alicyclobacillus acidoterrestris]UNO48503.1 isochorismatase family protein [Alicyclobacillus acidoterrestris]